VPSAVDVIAIQLPGREYRLGEPLMSDMAEIVTAVAQVMPPLLDKPYVFFGHSMGALIAFDLIRSLRQTGLPEPELLVASGRNAPQFQWRDPSIRLLSDEELVAAVRVYNGTPEELLQARIMRDLWLPRFRADMTASVMYRYVEQRPLTCPILVMSGMDDTLVSDAGLESWSAHTTGEVRFVRCPGDHFFIESARDLVLDRIRAEFLDRLTDGAASELTTCPGY
jgi:surfactin synthase thioesterase subunit